ncbi:hypothetical protein FKW77_010486 [Venturia effusa]|uniref:Uncharacterized protein n=1 Tax=Venturia effusa TaxID=50376 RepID=A0A517KXS9_9PEZI|nr:hypothetical protein FKW77_010486 [Venturia effusa]
MPLRKPPPKRKQSIREDTGRRPTFSSVTTTPAVRPEFGPTTALDDRPTSPSSSKRGSTNSDNPLIVEPEGAVRAFNTLEGLCIEHGERYPPPRPSSSEPRCQSVYDIYHYDFDQDVTSSYNDAHVQIRECHETPPISIHEGLVSMYRGPEWQPQIYDEGPIMKLKRRVSIAGSKFGDNIRRRGGSLKRRMSNRLGFQQFPEQVAYVGDNPNTKTPRFDGESFDEGARDDNGTTVWRQIQYEL